MIKSVFFLSKMTPIFVQKASKLRVYHRLACLVQFSINDFSSPFRVSDYARYWVKTCTVCLLLSILSGCGGSDNDTNSLQTAIGADDEDSDEPDILTGENLPECTTDTVSTGNQKTITGRISFDRVPVSENGLDYDSVRQDPLRSIVVESVLCTGEILDSGLTDNNGSYSLLAGAGQEVTIRVKARLSSVENGAHSWRVSLRDNTKDDALYVYDGDTVVTSLGDEVVDIHIPSGWTGSAYGADRDAGPFAILDTIYKGIIKITSVRTSGLEFPSLDIYWSERNRSVEGSSELSEGELVSTFYSNTISGSTINLQIYVLGNADLDTDEYDEHIILHEWGHYIEDQFSRSDSFGGAHDFTDLLDLRVAFSEGFSNAWAAILLDNAMYIDTGSAPQNSGGVSQIANLAIDIEENIAFKGQAPKGWFREISISSLVYDFYDSDIDEGETVELGIDRIFSVLEGHHKNTSAFTSIFSFVNGIKTNNSSVADDINSLTSTQQIADIIDDFATTESNFASVELEDNPQVYTVINVDVGTSRVCLTNDLGGYNKLANSRLLKLQVDVAGDYLFEVSPPIGSASADPGLFLFKQGTLVDDLEGTPENGLSVSVGLDEAIYVIELYEDEISESIDSSGISACFDVTVSSG